MTRVTLLILLLCGSQILNLKSQILNFESPLGLPATLTDLYIPGSEIEVIPRQNSDSSLVIRILQTKPAADGHRYDLEVYGLDPGTHPLADFLRHANSKAPIQNLPATFKVTTQHPLDTLPKPSDPQPVSPKKLGGYQTLIIVLGTLWLLILLAIIFYRKKQHADFTAENPPPTLHQKLQALVTTASTGDLTDHERANLERLILGHWKQKLPALQNLPPAQALVELRKHPDASPLILKLEEWLHSPNPDFSQKDITPLLNPYQQTANPSHPTKIRENS
ncbi:MAG: hypothetical protein ACJA16_000119 [Akkermansiaceae bacterium]|jgi:hypothetical protein